MEPLQPQRLSTFQPRPTALPHYISSMALITSSSGVWGPGLPQGRLLWGSLGPSWTPHLRGAHIALSRQLAWFCRPDTILQHHCGQISHVGDPGFRISLVGEVEKVSAVRWRVLEDFFFSRGFCQIDSMFGKALGILIFLLAATILPGFPASLLLLDCTLDNHIPTPGLFSPPVFLGRPPFIFSCLQLTGPQLFPDLFCPTTTSISWGRLCNETILVL